jgi:hypothetical protein
MIYHRRAPIFINPVKNYSFPRNDPQSCKMAGSSKPKSPDDSDDWATLSEEEKTAYWAKMRGPTPPPRDGKRPILTRINFFDGYFDFSKRGLGPNGFQVCQNLSVKNLPPDGKVISIKFCEVKRTALSGCTVCSMIERS